MSGIWAIAAVCFLSCYFLTFVDASGTAVARVLFVRYKKYSYLRIAHPFRSSYNITLKQPDTTNIARQSEFNGVRKKTILRFKKWTGKLSCQITVRKWVSDVMQGHIIYTKHINFREGKSGTITVRGVKRRVIAYLHKLISMLKDDLYVVVAVFVNCDRHYFGADCSRHCRAQDGPRGHYDCTAAGHRRCRPNWRNVAANCTEPDPCRPSRCQNGAACEETPGASFVCRCPRAFRGRLCEVPRSPCELAGPCRNGGLCVNVNGSAVCRCPGPRCKTDASVSAERRSVVVSAALPSAAAAVVVLIVVGLLRWRRATKRAVGRPPQPLQVEWRPVSDERVSSRATLATLVP